MGVWEFLVRVDSSVCTVELVGPSHFPGADRDALPRVRHWMSMEREQAHKKGGNKHKGLERLPDAQRRTRRSASLPRYTHGTAAHTRIAQERVATSRNRIG